MSPISFDGCFGWVHTPTLELKAIGVILCPGLKSDDSTGYRSLRLLADAFAGQGYSTLRLNYPGTGNSSNPGAMEYWSVWQQSVSLAADWLRENCGVQQVVLGGLRFGATLAATVAACRPDVAGLILLAPVPRGRSYVKQLMMETSQSSDSVDIGCVDLSAETIRLLNEVDLRSIALKPDCKVAIYSPSVSALMSDCEDTWRTIGVEVISNDFGGVEPLLRPTFANHEDPIVVSSIVSWLRKSFPAYLSSTKQARSEEDVEIRIDRCVETPFFFGLNRGAFGILCRPNCSEDDVVVMMGNTSGDPHCAAATVDIARHLGRKGITSLRFDFAGVGDNTLLHDAGSHAYETDRVSDFGAAIAALKELGYRKFAVQGLCSGAYHAYHAAVADPRIGIVLCVNLQFFSWVQGFPIENLSFRKTTDFLQMMRSRNFWAKLYFKLKGGEINLRRVVNRSPSFANDPKYSKELSKRARTLFLVCDGDSGADVANCDLPPSAKVERVPGLDHSVTRRHMRMAVADRMASFIRANSCMDDRLV